VRVDETYAATSLHVGDDHVLNQVCLPHTCLPHDINMSTAILDRDTDMTLVITKPNPTDHHRFFFRVENRWSFQLLKLAGLHSFGLGRLSWRMPERCQLLVREEES
jgi:hypothetical protein